MKTEKLAKTNIIDSEKAAHIEFFLETEIDQVYNFKKGYKRGSLQIDPGTVIYKNNYPCSGQFFHKLKSVSFDKKNMIISAVGRNKWDRSDSTIQIQLKIVGYKLPTTQIGEGWIFGNGTFE